MTQETSRDLVRVTDATNLDVAVDQRNQVVDRHLHNNVGLRRARRVVQLRNAGGDKQDVVRNQSTVRNVQREARAFCV